MGGLGLTVAFFLGTIKKGGDASNASLETRVCDGGGIEMKHDIV